ncbi:MAG: DUF2905 domain-containing protein [Geobacteraceae bacterium]|nr:DUF2905 domain-containing protein [Geobacteraceae bacterium]
MTGMGKALIALGLLMVLAGLLLVFSGRIPWLGRLPGDIYLRKGSFSFYFPLATCILISLFLSLLFWLFRK